MKAISFLIPTMTARQHCFREITDFINEQARNANLSSEIEIVSLCDEGQATIGAKRNQLVKRARGKFIAFVDDDDWVANTYVEDIVSTIKTYPDLDCIGFYGEVYFDGKFGGHMIHTTLCHSWTEGSKVYYRPPNHLNPVRTELARRIVFKHADVGEDHFWSIDLQRTGTLRREVFLGHKPLYIYRCGGPVRGL